MHKHRRKSKQQLRLDWKGWLGLIYSDMKKYSFISMLAIAAMVAFSCTKALEVEVGTSVEDETTTEVKDPLIITAYSDDNIAPDTKTSLDDVNVLWADTDVVSAYKSGDVNPHVSTVTSVTDAGKKATFTFADLTVGTDVTHLIYPSSAAGKESAGTYAITLPSEQEATVDSFADGANLAIADGSVSADAVQFKNIGALIGFSISNDNVASVEISADQAMTGAAVVNPGSPISPTVEKSGLTYVEITGGIANGSQYYAVVYPGTYSGLTIKVTDTDGKLATYSNPNELVLDRNANKQIADLTVADGKWKTLKKTNWSHTFTAKAFSSNSTVELSGKNWTLAGEGGYWSYDGTKGQQFGKADNAYSNLTLTSEDYGVDEGIDNVIVSASTANSATATISVSVGGHLFECNGSTSTSLTSSNTPYDFLSPDGKKRTGKIIISIKQPTTSKAIYIKSIEANNLLPKVATPEISITSNTATITCGTAGSTIYYTTNGSTPTSSSTVYSGEFSVEPGVTIKAIATMDDMRDSAVASKTNGTIADYVFNTDAGLSALGISKPDSGKGTNLSTSTPYVANGVSMSVTNGTGTKTRVWNSSGTTDLRVYSGSSITVDAGSGHYIKKVTFTGSINMTVGGTEVSGKTWSGSSQTVTFANTSTTSQISTIRIIYQ